MKTHCAALLLLGLLCLTTAEVRLEVSFDISGVEETETGYTSITSIDAFLNSESVKWLRYFKVLTAGNDKSGPSPMRVAHMQFKDIHAWASFEQSLLVETFALYDHFFINSRRSILEPVASQTKFPQREGTEDEPGGWIWQLRYTIADGADEEFAKAWSRLAPIFATEAERNEGFMSREQFTAKSMIKLAQNIVDYEFKNLASMMDLMRGKTYSNIVESMRGLCSDWAVTILSPGDADGQYFSGAGADKHPDWDSLEAEMKEKEATEAEKEAAEGNKDEEEAAE